MNIETYPPEQTAEVMAANPPSPHAAPPSPSSPPSPPPAQTPQPVQTMPPKPVKQRRVGTFTLGVTLIMLGILVPLSLVFGGRMWKLMQFAPLVLLVLGVEILVYAIRFKSEKFSYDGVSVFLVVLITFVTLLGSLIAPPIASAVEYLRAESVVAQETRDALEQEMAQGNSQGYVSVYNSESNGWEALADKEVETIDWRLTARVHYGDLAGSSSPDQIEVAEAFAAMAAAAEKQETVVELLLEYTQNTAEGTTTYQVRLLGNMIHSMTPEEMNKWIHVDFEPSETPPTSASETAAQGTATQAPSA